MVHPRSLKSDGADIVAIPLIVVVHVRIVRVHVPSVALGVRTSLLNYLFLLSVTIGPCPTFCAPDIACSEDDPCLEYRI